MCGYFTFINQANQSAVEQEAEQLETLIRAETIEGNDYGVVLTVNGLKFDEAGTSDTILQEIVGPEFTVLHEYVGADCIVIEDNTAGEVIPFAILHHEGDFEAKITFGRGSPQETLDLIMGDLFTDEDNGKKQVITTGIDGLTITMSDGSYNGKYYKENKTIRLYASNSGTLIVDYTLGTIESVVLTFEEGTVNETHTDTTWTFDTTLEGSSARCDISQITINYTPNP